MLYLGLAISSQAMAHHQFNSYHNMQLQGVSLE